MDVLTRFEIPSPPIGDDEPTTKSYVEHLLGGGGGISSIGVPSIARLRSRNNQTIRLEFSQPMIENCFVQFYRVNRGGFRRLGPDPTGNGAGMPLGAIPVGSTWVWLDPTSIFRPPIIPGDVLRPPRTYSRYYRDVHPNIWNNDLPPGMRNPNHGKRDIKCILKFGVVQRYREQDTNHFIEKFGPMSIETLRIMRWRQGLGGQHWTLSLNVY